MPGPWFGFQGAGGLYRGRILTDHGVMRPIELLFALPAPLRPVAIAALAVAAHLLVLRLRRFSESALAPTTGRGGTATERFARRYPKAATLTSLAVSALTFVIYFAAVGAILRLFGVPVGAYVASASVVGLAVAFGSQGLVQDIVIGLTLVFSDVFDIGDVVEVTGQIGRVEKIGLRFTTLVNFLGQRVYVPNRNILTLGRFRGGCVRAYVDAQLPDGGGDEEPIRRVEELARGMRAQHPAIVLTEPEVLGVLHAEPGGWRYVRLKLRLWPGQTAIIETTFRQRLLAALRELDPGYADWMVTVTYRAV